MGYRDWLEDYGLWAMDGVPQSGTQLYDKFAWKYDNLAYYEICHPTKYIRSFI
jgi:hypothetical protein